MRGGVALVWLAVAVPVAVLAARVTWSAMGLDAGALAALPEPARARAAPPDLAPILALAPFGRAEVAAPERVRETELGLTLHGVMLAEGAGSIAFIAAKGGKSLPYGVGEAVPGGATLIEVAADQVVLIVDGARETLSFPVAPTKADGAAAIRARLPGAAGGVALPREGQAPDQVIDDYRRLIAANPQAVLDRLGLTATPDGYRIGETAHPGVRRAGLRPGDTVARVNGVAVGDVEADRRLFEQIAEEGRARVEVVRDGRSVVLSFPLR